MLEPTNDTLSTYFRLRDKMEVARVREGQLINMGLKPYPLYERGLSEYDKYWGGTIEEHVRSSNHPFVMEAYGPGTLLRDLVKIGIDGGVATTLSDPRGPSSELREFDDQHNIHIIPGDFNTGKIQGQIRAILKQNHLDGFQQIICCPGIGWNSAVSRWLVADILYRFLDSNGGKLFIEDLIPDSQTFETWKKSLQEQGISGEEVKSYRYLIITKNLENPPHLPRINQVGQVEKKSLLRRLTQTPNEPE